MLHEGVILAVQAGKDIPPKLLAAVHAVHNKVWGAALIKPLENAPEDGLQNELLTAKAASPTLEKVINFLDTYKPNPRVIFLGSFSAGDDEVPPFHAVTDDEAVMITVFAEGNFSDLMEDKTSTKNPAIFLMEEYLEAKIDEVWSSVDSFDAFFEKLNSKNTKRELEAQITDRGSFLVVGANGDIAAFTKGNLGNAYDWGWISYIANDKEDALAKGKDPAATPTPGKSGGKLDLDGSSTDTDAGKAGLKVNPEVSGTYYTIKCPKEVKGSGARRKWWEELIGEVPEGDKFKDPNYEHPVPVKKGTKLKDFQEAVKAKKVMDLIARIMPEEEKKEFKGGTTPALGAVLNPENKKKWDDVVMPGILDRMAKNGKTPEAIAKEEEDMPSFIDIVGWTENGWDEFKSWDAGMVISACRQSPELMAWALKSLIYTFSDYVASIEEQTEPVSKDEAAENKKTKAAAGGKLVL